jgi:hypothetical protein
MAEVTAPQPLARYMRRACVSCRTTGEHQAVRVISPDDSQWRPGYQCATCSAVQLLPLDDAAPVKCTHCGRIHQPNEPACAVRRCLKCGRRSDHPVHDLSGTDRERHDFEDVR